MEDGSLQCSIKTLPLTPYKCWRFSFSRRTTHLRTVVGLLPVIFAMDLKDSPPDHRYMYHKRSFTQVLKHLWQSVIVSSVSRDHFVLLKTDGVCCTKLPLVVYVSTLFYHKWVEKRKGKENGATFSYKINMKNPEVRNFIWSCALIITFTMHMCKKKWRRRKAVIMIPSGR